MSRAVSSAILGAAALLAASACIPPPPAPLAPEQLFVVGPPEALLRRAVSIAAAEGWTPVVSDVSGGTVVLRRELVVRENRSAVVCQFAAGSIADGAAVAALQLTLQATAVGDSTALTAATRIVTSFPSLSGGTFAQGPSERVCASSGTVEGPILRSFRKPKYAGVP